MRILVTNDDGIASPGLWALAAAMQATGLGEVVVVAPSDERSGAGMSFPPLPLGEIYEVAPPEGFAGIPSWAVTGTPVACVTAAVLGAVGARPDMVASGINRGLNTGRNVMVSGTVGAAMAGAIWGIPGLAVSQQLTRDAPIDWRPAAEAAQRLAPLVLVLPRAETLAPVLNVNAPRLADGVAPRGIVQTRLSEFFYGQIIALDGVAELGDQGRLLRYSFDRARLPIPADIESDDGAVHAGYVAVTPLVPMATAALDLRGALEAL
jgi:5'-nucleotidase